MLGGGGVDPLPLMQKMVDFFQGAHHPSEIYGQRSTEWSDGNPDAWAASVTAAIEAARNGEVIAPADRGEYTSNLPLLPICFRPV